jgi:hypothetical protein
MADSKTRKQRLRQRRQQAGLKAVVVWLSPDAQMAMTLLRGAGEPIDAFVNRALVSWSEMLLIRGGRDPRVPGTRDGTRPEAEAGAQATAALVGLLTVLFPPGRPIYPRTRYGWKMFPLAEINELLAPEGWVIRATKTRTPARAIFCSDAYGGMERYGLFELKRLEEYDSDGAGD